MPYPYDAIQNSINFVLHFRIADSYLECKDELQRRLLFFTLEDEQKKVFSNGPVDRLSRWEVDSPLQHGYQRTFEHGGVWVKPIMGEGLHLPEPLWEVMVGGHPKIKREDGNDFLQGYSTIAKEKGRVVGASVLRGDFSCLFEGCQFAHTIFDSCTFDACEFHNVDFTKAKFINCTWSDVSFVGPKTNFSGSQWENNIIDSETVEIARDTPHVGSKGTGAWLFEPNKEGAWTI